MAAADQQMGGLGLRSMSVSLWERRSTAARTARLSSSLLSHSNSQEQHGMLSTREEPLYFCFGSVFPVTSGSALVNLYLCLPISHLQNAVSKASFTRTCEILVFQAQCLVHSKHSTNVHSLLPPQKHISNENGSQQKIQVGNSGFQFTETLPRMYLFCT